MHIKLPSCQSFRKTIYKGLQNCFQDLLSWRYTAEYNSSYFVCLQLLMVDYWTFTID